MSLKFLNAPVGVKCNRFSSNPTLTRTYNREESRQQGMDLPAEPPKSQKVPREFYLQPTLDVARALLGKLLVHHSVEGTTSGKIVETEAYLGETDRASHAWGGRRSERNKVLYGPPGHAYIYLIYGRYCCLNLVTQLEEVPECVLIRALEPVEGVDLMARRRNITQVTPRNVKNLANGPGKLCMAMGIDRNLYGTDVCGEIFYVIESQPTLESKIVQAPRIGVDYAGEASQYPWRFLLADNPFISKKPK